MAPAGPMALGRRRGLGGLVLRSAYGPCAGGSRSSSFCGGVGVLRRGGAGAAPRAGLAAGAPAPAAPRPRLAPSAAPGWRRARATLRELWAEGGAPLSGEASAPLPLPVVPASSVRARLESSHHWGMMRIFGDPMSSTPPSAKHLFISCAVIEGIFLFVNIGTMSPFIFEKMMPYHLKYTGLIIGWWGGTYCGLNVARYGPLARGGWSTARLAAGAVFVSLGAASLALADGVPGLPKVGPWPSYWLLITSFGGMAAFDSALHKRQMIPPWLLKWKLGVSGLIVASLLLGVVKGQYLERNATALIMAQAMRDD